MAQKRLYKAAAFGGAGWSPRTVHLSEEIGIVWGNCGTGHQHAHRNGRHPSNFDSGGQSHHTGIL